jgi:glucosamine-6-phosphate deaminase
MVFVKDYLIVNQYTSKQEMADYAAEKASTIIKEILQKKREINIIFAAAPSQNEFLEVLTSNSSIEWSRINAFHMDEYIGLPSNAQQGFGNFLYERLFSKVSFNRVHYINGQAEDLDEECKRYAGLLEKYPVDIVCLGIGENGHIAFNDPHVALFNDQKSVKVVDLELECRMQQVNDNCFKAIEDVPRMAITLTIPTLLAAQYMLCVVPGIRKANAVYNTLNGEISEKCPASILRRKENSFLFIDNESSSLL